MRSSFLLDGVDSFNNAFTAWAEAMPNPFLRKLVGFLHALFLVTLFFAALFDAVAVAALCILPIMWFVELVIGRH